MRYFRMYIQFENLRKIYSHECINQWFFIQYFKLKLFSIYDSKQPSKLMVFIPCILATCSNSVFFYLFLRKGGQRTVFEQILISHAICDFINGICVLPLFDIEFIFEFWPLGKEACMYFLTLDTITGTLSIIHVLYLSYVRMRCILAPKKYLQERIIRNNVKVLLLQWIILGTFFSAFFVPDIDENYVEYNCSLADDSIVVSFIYYVTFFIIPLSLPVASTIYILHHIKKINKKKKHNLFVPVSSSSSAPYSIKKSIFNNVQIKLSFIILVFCVGFAPSVTVWPIKYVCDSCISKKTYQICFIMAYLTSFTNPIIFLALNRNFFKKEK